MTVDELIAQSDPLVDGNVPSADSSRASSIFERSLSTPAPRQLRHPTRRQLRWLAPITLAAVAATIVAVVLVGSQTSVPVTPGGGSTVVIPAPVKGQWSLAGYITQSGWQANSSSGPLPTSLQGTNQLVCPSTSTCYAVGVDNSSGNSEGVIAVTHDGGSTWQQSLLLTGGISISDISCNSALQCRAVGNVTNSFLPPHLYSTSDGGQTWQTVTLPGAGMEIYQVACSTSADCVVIGSVSWSTAATSNNVVFVTTDGGQDWRPGSLPPTFGSYGTGLQCFSNGHCLAVGYETAKAAQGGQTDSPFALYSDDSGATWSPASMPAIAAGTFLVSCSSPLHCVGIDVFSGVKSGIPTVVGELVTSDGGENWTSVTSTGLNSSVAAHPLIVDSLSCTSNSHCWASGHLLGSLCEGSCPYAPDEAVMLSTDDGGLTWTTVPLPAAPSASLQYNSDYPVTCANSSHCFAVGQLTQTSTSLPTGSTAIEQDVVISWVPLSATSA
jgi:hypothetical protein